KYRAGDRPLAVSITGEARGDSVLYKVADNGSGIAAKDLGRIWDIFYRGAGASAGEGEGIGLTVVKYMAEKNGGSIKAESEEGGGTVFHLELPAAGGNK
ncbi:MAG TPA: sensor histidine kinase, partial [Candidatus Glassbacteria bacterium]|nr:sensor histidine kinase [Candidatus Glassbacteria bacterium]